MEHVLAAGSGDDAVYEHSIAEMFGSTLKTIVVPDCYQFDEVKKVKNAFGSDKGSSNHIAVFLPHCIGAGENPQK